VPKKKKKNCIQHCGDCNAFVKKTRPYAYKSACNSPFETGRGEMIRNVRIVKSDTIACKFINQIELIEK